MSSRRGPTFPSRAAETLNNGPAPGVFVCDVLANRQPRLEHNLDLEGLAEVRDP
jgi:hypothetical protein